MPEPVTTPTTKATSPDYEKLIQFLVQPFLESPETLKLDCEISQAKARVWIRLAFEGADKGRVFGRGGRNIQAIRTVLDAIAKLSGHSIHLDVYGGPPASHSGNGDEHDDSTERSHPRRPSPSRGGPRPRR